ncbi:MAG TPA: RDD family protein [Flavipsychrobacter sp.]|nr:RDD family protein [Flavipsychrobacter sp.]
MTNDYLTDSFIYKTNLKKRIIATLLDYAIIFLFTDIYLELFGHNNPDGSRSVNGLLGLPVFAVWFIYFVVIEACYGATLAHQGLYLKVLTIDRKEIEWTQALKRHLLDPIDIFFYGIPAIIAIRNSDKHQRLGDMWAKTIVVDTKDAQQYFKQDTIKA